MSRNEKDKYMMIIMIYELLFGQKKISSGGSVKKAIMEHLQELNEKLKDIKPQSDSLSTETGKAKRTKNFKEKEKQNINMIKFKQ